MSDSVISKLSIEVEAQQSKLDRDLDQVEKKAKSAGAKAEESLSLGGVASKLVGVFAALGTVEAGFKALTGVTKLFSGDLEGALDTIEQMPFGIGPAIGAARDFFEVISGSREEAERLAAEWAKVATGIQNAQAKIDAFKKSQDESGLSDTDKLNLDIAEANEQNRQLNKFRNNAIQASADGFKEIGPKSVEFLKSIGIEAKTTQEAIDGLDKKIKENVKTVRRLREESIKSTMARVPGIEEQTRIYNLQSQGTTRDADLDVKRIQVERDRDKQLADARSDLEKTAIQEQFDLRMRLIDDEAAARRQSEKDAAFERERQAFQENQKRRERWEEQSRREAEKQKEEQKKANEQAERDRFIEGKGIAADEFLRTSFEGGDMKIQEVKDPEAVAAIDAGNAILDQIARNTKNTSATLA